MPNKPVLSLDTHLLASHVNDTDLSKLQPNINHVLESIEKKTCQGNNFLGWLDLPNKMQSQLEHIKTIAAEVRERSNVLVSIGIGGSYHGARAAIDFLSDPFLGNDKVIYLGHHIGTDYTMSLLDFLTNKQVYVNVISKSGTTTEPALVFRLLLDRLKGKYSDDELAQRIITTTDAGKGVMRQITDAAGYRSFIIDDDIGGRFSVLSPVGLFPIAVAGFDIEALLAGAQDMADYCLDNNDVLSNDVLKYAASRYVLYQKSKTVEILSSFEPAMQYMGEWWKQLYGESEGKDQKGIYPTSANLTTDLHSLGQFMQEGSRFLFETFLHLEKSRRTMNIPSVKGDVDGLNFIAGKTVDFVNQQAYQGTRYAHADGGLPNMTINLPKRDEYTLGALFYFFEFAVTVSGLLLGVNPFNQPGVEAYKQNMFALLGKSEYEERRAMLQKKIKGEE